ncbi:MAG: methyltransferase domain-containing protein [archaeon]|nr:methyltransferase domain-containing protein [archaeon]MCP8314408.1 methyltransferase domain-containing protein [archaeon]MCP8317285.1 methyltransferase domain-containing protein [archaeon]MCP8319809.1 methyltransferase domain-containing protein [archaeon]
MLHSSECSGLGLSELNLDVGAGNRRKVGYIAIDIDNSIKPDIVCDNNILPLKDESIDNVYWSHNIEHLANPHKAMHEIHRILRIGGKLTIICPNASFPWTLYLAWKYGDCLFTNSPFERHLWVVKPEALKRLLKEEGFEVEAFQEVERSERHWSLQWCLACNPLHKFLFGLIEQVKLLKTICSRFDDFLYAYINPKHHLEIKLAAVKVATSSTPPVHLSSPVRSSHHKVSLWE